MLKIILGTQESICINETKGISHRSYTQSWKFIIVKTLVYLVTGSKVKKSKATERFS